MVNANMKKAVKLLVERGLTQRAVAKELGIDETTISKWNDKEEYTKYKESEERKFLRRLVPKALNKMVQLLDAKSESVQFEVAKDILDRCGFKPTNKMEISGLESEKSKLDSLLEQMGGGD